MTVAVLVLLALTAATGLVLTARGERVRPAWGAAVLAGLLGAAAVVAWTAEDASSGLLQGTTVAAVAAAVLGGGPVATAVLGAADPAAVGVAAALLAGSAEGLAVVLAVKGLGRFAELRAPAAAERFIVGTLASGLWAAACVGVVMLLRG